jgi:hypothetical protein
MNSLFKQIVGVKPKRNAFDLSHERKFSMKMGDLVPILCEEVIPGDTFQLNTEVLMRFAPMVSPVMHRINVFTHFFFVPNRLIWSEWEDFITGGEDGQAMPVVPYKDIGTGSQAQLFKVGGLADYLGHASVSAGSGETVRLNMLPFRAYLKIYNEYYRDQNLQDEVPIGKGSGNDVITLTNDVINLKTRAWEKDYFTSALPWAQKGDSILLPLGNEAPVTFNDAFNNSGFWVANETGDPEVTGDNLATRSNTGITYNVISNKDLSYSPGDTLIADLGDATATTINDLRRAVKLQQWLERNARGGSRYVESILSHFGVKSSDARLQRPEFLGGGKHPVTVSEVLSTSPSTSATTTEFEDTPQGNMAGHAVSVGNSHRFKKFFEEHGYVIGIMSVLPKTAYYQGTRRHFLKDDKFDYYWPELAQLGEQEVYEAELYDEMTSNRKNAFGYQSRYSEYKYVPSTVHGDFKESLDFWHMGRNFSNKPVLNEDFIKADPTHRIFAVQDTDVTKLYVQIYHNLKAIRPIPRFNNPSLL